MAEAVFLLRIFLFKAICATIEARYEMSCFLWNAMMRLQKMALGPERHQIKS
jgi:hypothetical protein